MGLVKWRKVDLHIHSNASHDCTITPEDIVNRIIEKNINVFAITDHNNVNNVDIFRAIVAKKKEQGIEIEFFPGIELRTDRGKDGVAIHIIVIFPEYFTKQEIIDKFLSKDGICLTYTYLTEKGREKIGEASENKLFDKGCEVSYVSFDKTVSVARSLGALTIAVHPKDRAGIEKELDYQNRSSGSFAELLVDSVNAIDIMELPKNIEKAKYNQAFYLNQFNNFIKVMPSIVSSDSHVIETLGNKFTYVKMDTLDFEGLKQIIYEPQGRIFLSESTPPVPVYPYISKLNIKGGYYESKEFVFSPELNCIIGGRGSGKSVIIDLLRFVFNKYETSNKDNQDYLDRLYNLLKYGNSVEVTICHHGNDLNIVRTCYVESKKEKNGDITYVDKSPVPSYQEIDIELYSQGNLKQITKRANEQLRLIDEIGNNQDILTSMAELKTVIILNAQEQLELFKSINGDLQKANQKDDLVQQIKDKEIILKDGIIKEFSSIQEDKKYYDIAIKNLNSILELSMKHYEQISEYTEIKFPDQCSPIIQAVKDCFESITKYILEIESGKNSYLNDSIQNIKDINVNNSPWISFYSLKESEYYSYLKEKNLENLADETNQLKILKDNLLDIENNILPRLNKRLDEIRNLQNKRDMLLQSYQDMLNNVKGRRLTTCQDISSRRDDLRLSISSRLDKREFQKHIETIINGLNIKFKDAAANIIHATKSVPEFIIDIKKQDIKFFEKKYKITADAAGKILSKYSSDLPISEYQLSIISEELFDLELINFENVVDIEIKDLNDGRFKKFSRFSPGQQCAYLLSILLDANDNPLIIDQPEDELDWNYISSFIDKLRCCKIDDKGKGRQFIFVTHNQNITVLADSEGIFKVANIPIKDEGGTPTGNLEAHGGIERKSVRDAVLSLEGGEDAFQRRKKRYGI